MLLGERARGDFFCTRLDAARAGFGESECVWTATSLFKGGFASKIRVYFVTRAAAKRVLAEERRKVLCVRVHFIQ